METTERNYNELYGNKYGYLNVFVHTGLYNIFAATRVKTGVRKRFNSLKDLEAYLYNNGYHLVTTDRATIFARNIMEGQSPSIYYRPDHQTRRDTERDLLSARKQNVHRVDNRQKPMR